MKQIYYIAKEEHKRTESYSQLENELKQCGKSYQYTDSIWILTSELSFRQVYEKLKPHLHSNDRVFKM